MDIYALVSGLVMIILGIIILVSSKFQAVLIIASVFLIGLGLVVIFASDKTENIEPIKKRIVRGRK